ncbi:MAG TPA: ABC transporter permease subunit, partial [Candidatus Polarisedimenticolia bacterium]|nr:ABC transporter permease subunit [Candidatus Polarisedimenticolia bacterium]
MNLPSATQRARPQAAGRRPRITSARVHLVDRAAAITITLGGVSVIAAVLGIMVYLVWVVAPLFAPAALSREASFPVLLPGEAEQALFVELDEYRAMGVCVLQGGAAVYFDAGTGRPIERRRLFPDTPRMTAWSRPPGGDHAAFGFEDGTVRSARVGFLAEPVAVPDPDTSDAPAGPEGGVVQRLPSGAARRVTPLIEVDEPLAVAPDADPILLLDYRPTDRTTRLAVLTRGGTLLLDEVARRKNLLTGVVTSDLSSRRVPLPDVLPSGSDPRFLLLTTQGDQLYLAWSDGSLLRYDLRDPADALLAEQLDLVGPPEAVLSALSFMPGEQSIVSADSSGNVRSWFRIARAPAGRDGYAMVSAHTMERLPSAAASIAVSARDKSFAAGATDGSLRLYHMTSDRLLAESRVDPPSPLGHIQIAPKGDAILGLGNDGRASIWSLSNPHPETSLTSVFGRVWYEGYTAPDFTWQSSSGTDDFEPKFSLTPLIFGTLKATFYSMIFAVPIALFAAIYTSEFLDRKYRAPLKSMIEMMASLPSVVLGFIAALVLAPIVENAVLAVLVAFALVPLVALGLGYLWQTLPRRLAVPLSGSPQLLVLAAASLLAVLAARPIGATLETLLFEGDFKAWLDGRSGTGAPGIALLCWPPVTIGLLLLDRRFVAEALHRRSRGGGSAAADLARYGLLVLLSVAVSWAAGAAGAAAGLDPRGDLVGTYVQRNALVVGFVMGFAVIPIIYTIAEDALSAVPQALRSASLGCGASRWQTATRVVLPVALSGIFSALMVGLGRAVGETMIVLMAAGNTPVMEMNLFSG